MPVGFSTFARSLLLVQRGNLCHGRQCGPKASCVSARRHLLLYSMLGVARYICFLCKRKFGSAALLTKHKLRAQQLVPLNKNQRRERECMTREPSVPGFSSGSFPSYTDEISASRRLPTIAVWGECLDCRLIGGREPAAQRGPQHVDAHMPRKCRRRSCDKLWLQSKGRFRTTLGTQMGCR